MAGSSFSDPDELFDVVDADDHVLRQATRRAVHAQGLLHRAVHVLVHDVEGRLFLQRRSAAKDSFPGCWDCSCTGHLDAGEDYEAAARRELGEELGWHDDSLPLRPVLRLTACAETGQEFIQIYLLGPTSGPFALNAEEISEGRWIHPEDLDREMHQIPESFAGALRFLWAGHRGKLVPLTFARPN